MLHVTSCLSPCLWNTVEENNMSVSLDLLPTFQNLSVLLLLMDWWIARAGGVSQGVRGIKGHDDFGGWGSWDDANEASNKCHQSGIVLWTWQRRWRLQLFAATFIVLQLLNPSLFLLVITKYVTGLSAGCLNIEIFSVVDTLLPAVSKCQY